VNWFQLLIIIAYHDQWNVCLHSILSPPTTNPLDQTSNTQFDNDCTIGSTTISIQIPIEVEVEVVKPHFKVDTEVRMVDIINMKVKLMEVDEETLEEEEVKEVMEVVVEVIEVNNQIVIQIATIAGNLGTWQRIVIKRSMMHEMESCNKGIKHKLAIKVMNNYL
jgi:hypothetical protein